MKQWIHYVSSGNEKQQGKRDSGTWCVMMRVDVEVPSQFDISLKHLRVQIAGFADLDYGKLSQHGY